METTLEMAQRWLREHRSWSADTHDTDARSLAKLLDEARRDAVAPRTETPKVSVLDEVAAELASARAAHGPQNSAHEGYAVLLEEVDELWDLVKQNPHKTPDATSDRARNVRVQRERMRAEAIQIAAMAIRFIEDVCDR